jgi:phosphoserine phosphatase RsbU/P
MTEHGKILVVDDDEGKRYVTARMLRAHGFDVFEAANGIAALEMLAIDPDVVVLDIKLPDIDGHEICRRLKADPKTSAIMVLQLSATFNSTEDKVFGLEVGADAYLTHPLEFPELLATVRALMRIRRADQERSTLLRRAEESERRYRTLADLIPDIVWTCDAQLNADWANDRFYEYTGVRTGAEPRMPWHRDDAKSVEDAVAVARRGGSRFEVEARVRRFDGVYRWFLHRSEAVCDDRGAIVRWVGASTDIEDQKRVAETLRHAARVREQLVGIVGHDLRNPLGAISMASSLLMRGGTLSEKDHRVVGRVASAAERMAQIIDQLLDFTRARLGGGLTIEPGDADLEQVCRRVVEEIETAHPTRAVRLTTTGDLRGRWDGPRLAQLASNLLGNAIQHGDPNQPITITASGEAHRVLLRVHNAGQIPSRLLPTLFEPFHQGDRPSGGLGLGLFIACEIARGHGGTIEVQSNGKEGTTFILSLPREIPPPAN